MLTIFHIVFSGAFHLPIRELAAEVLKNVAIGRIRTESRAPAYRGWPLILLSFSRTLAR
jgi:hypothetical protein